VSWRINNIDSMLIVLVIHPVPKASRGSRGNSDTSFLFLLHPIHNRSTIMHLTNFMGDTGVEKYTLCGRSLSSIYVSRNSNVSIAA
jgi:hypothetical protein